MTPDEYIMLRCINLAKQATGNVSPNPLVGCVIVKNKKIAAEGYHRHFGKAHAEINAIDTAITKGVKLKGAVIYINLEPCYHYGKTPPCVNKIIQLGFSKVIIGMKDPNPLVSGKSIKKLRKNGIEVISGVLEKECRELSRFFIKHISTGLPYITLKAAQTMDGKIARRNHDSKWITSFESRAYVHKLRNEYDAVLVGRNTVKYDNPELTVRHVKGRNPYRVVIDVSLSLNTKYKIFSDSFAYRTIILTGIIKNKAKAEKLREKSIQIIECKNSKGKIDIKDAMKKLGSLGIASIMVEGGAETYSHFLNHNLVDEALIFLSPKVFGDGIQTFKNNFNFTESIKSVEKISSDVLLRFKLKEY